MAILLVCPEPRLRRLIQLALEPTGATLLDRSECRGVLGLVAPNQSPCRSRAPTPVSAVIVDLDSLGCSAVATLDRLRQLAVPEQTPLLFISVYPAEIHDVEATAGRRYLMPPFAPADLRRQLALAVATAP